MRAVVVQHHGGPEVLAVVDRPDPVPGADEVLVEVAVAGVNYIDTYHRSGLYPTTPPFTPGVEGVGVVRQVGDQVDTEVKPGDRVGWVLTPGSYAEKAVLPAARVFPIPDSVDSELAAASLLQGATAHYLTNDTYQVQPGDDVLVHAAAGGMGLLLTQMVKAKGGRVIGTVSTPQKEKLALKAGADHVIRYTEVDFAEETLRLTGGRGVAVVYDGVGAATFDGSLASLRARGMLALYGQASGPVPAFNPSRLADGGSLFLTRPSLGHYVATRDELLARMSDVLGMVSSGQLAVHIGERYPLERARAAHDDLEARRTTGKQLLIP